MGTKNSGFASMPKDKQREIARQGGVMAQLTGKAHRWTSETARDAGRKGGMARRGRLDKADAST